MQTSTSTISGGISQGRICLRELVVLNLANLGDDEERHAHGRCEGRNHQVQYHDDAEMYWVNTEAERQRNEDRHDDQKDRQRPR